MKESNRDVKMKNLDNASPQHLEEDYEVATQHSFDEEEVVEERQFQKMNQKM